MTEGPLNMHIAYDHEESTEMNARYFVYEDGVVIYKGTYPQCLVVYGAISLDPEITLEEINSKCNGYLFEENK